MRCAKYYVVLYEFEKERLHRRTLYYITRIIVLSITHGCANASSTHG